MTDVEAFLGQRIRDGELAVGDRFELRQLDVQSRGAHVSEVEVLAREDVVDASATAEDEEPRMVGCFKVRERDPKSGASTILWLDDDGAFVRLVAEGGVSYRRVARGQAEAVPVRPAEYSVTTPSRPWLERIMSADRLWLDLHLRGDADRPLPEFPTSPWSRVVDIQGSDEEGWIVKMRVDAFDDPDLTTTLPIEAKGLERYLESTALMPTKHEELQAVVAEVVGDEKDARTAAEALARWVFRELDKKSPNVAQASALQILRERRGDCSEHALLYVALCRAAGIPARECSGYVCIGPQWGAHAWAEIWLGEWLGADPTTGEVGPGARYVFFGYSEDPESFPGIVSARARGRLRFVVTRLEEGEESVDLEDEDDWYLHDRESGRYRHALAGIELRDVPRDWVVRVVGNNRAVVRAPDLTVTVRADADQGFTLEQFGGANATFGGLPARKIELGTRGVAYMLHSRRRLMQILVQTQDVAKMLPLVEAALAPTFADPPRGPDPEDLLGAENGAEEGE
jgi:transglutaminase-like putative cysteine protease